MDNSKKAAAAISAVIRYIQEEEEEILCSQHFSMAEKTKAKPVASFSMNLWGNSGRQSQMQMGNFMQMKAFHRTKLVK